MRRAAWRWLACLALALAQLARVTPVGAQQAKALDADELFKAGLRGMRAGDYAAACPKLLASYRLDPLPGALFTLAECEAGWKKLATALGHYQKFVGLLPALPTERRGAFEERRQIALEQIEALRVTTPELTVVVGDGAPAKLLVKLDGNLVPAATYGVSQALDPGQYTLEAELDGQRVWARAVSLKQGSRERVEVVMPRPAAAAAENAPQRPTRPWLYVAGGVGAAGLTTGLIAGALALGHEGTVDEQCPELKCTPAGRDALDTARAEARVSTIGFALGLTGVAAAGLLLLVPLDAPASPSSGANARPRSALVTDGRSISLLRRF
jgi:hypothetical protein